MPQLKGVLPAASGYKVLGVLNSPAYAKMMITRFYCETVTGNITSQDFAGAADLKNQGDTVIFRRDPKGEIFDYIKNQDLEVSTLNSEPIVMHVNRAKYWNLKIDQVDLAQVTDVKKYIDAFLENSKQDMAQFIDKEVLREIPLAADCYNKGVNAGKRSRAYNLGAAGSPVSITSENLMRVLSYVSGVMGEQCSGKSAYIVLPLEAKTLFFNNQTLVNAFASGMSQSIVMNGKIPSSFFGVDIYFSPNVSKHKEGTGFAYNIPFGVKEATGFITQLTKQQHITEDPRSFAEYWRGLQIYDFKTIRPELVGALYATFNVTV